MKKIKYLLLLMMGLFVVGCDQTFTSDVTMEIQEGSLTTKGATIIITDYSKTPNTYGEYFKIERKEGSKWVSQEPIIDNYAFNMIGYNVDENHQLILETDWEWIYGSLSPGTYRIVKEGPNGSDLTTNFIIE